MCGRIAQYFTRADLNQAIPNSRGTAYVTPKCAYNLAPGTLVGAITREIQKTGPPHDWVYNFHLWGVKPTWSNSLLINAQAEKMVGGSRSLWKNEDWQHCLVPASGFYEWKRSSQGRHIPHFIRRGDRRPMLLAGITRLWKTGRGYTPSLVIITTAPNALMSKIHSRMPAIVTPERWREWLDVDQKTGHRLLCPYGPDNLEAYAVSAYVNDARHQGPQCIDPVQHESDDS